MANDPKSTKDGDKPASKGDSAASKGDTPKTPPAIVAKLITIDTAVGWLEQAFVAAVLFGLIGVGAYQFLVGNLFDKHDQWPHHAVRYFVFFTAMGGAAIAAQKNSMMAMDIVSRKLPNKATAGLRIFVAIFVVFACWLLYRAGMVRVEDVSQSPGPHEFMEPATAYMALPIGSLLIAFHFILHAICDAIYLATDTLPAAEERVKAH